MRVDAASRRGAVRATSRQSCPEAPCSQKDVIASPFRPYFLPIILFLEKPSEPVFSQHNRSVLLGFSSLFCIKIFPVFENAAFRLIGPREIRHEPGARKMSDKRVNFSPGEAQGLPPARSIAAPDVQSPGS